MADDLSCKVNVSALSESQDDEPAPPGPDSLKHLSNTQVEEDKKVKDWETPQDKTNTDVLDSIQGRLDTLTLQGPRQQEKANEKNNPTDKNPVDEWSEYFSFSDGVHNFISCLAKAAFVARKENWEAHYVLRSPGLEMGLGWDDDGKEGVYLRVAYRLLKNGVKFDYDYKAHEALLSRLLDEVARNPQATHIPHNLFFLKPPGQKNIHSGNPTSTSTSNPNPNSNSRGYKNSPLLHDLVPDMRRCQRGGFDGGLLLGSLFVLYNIWRVTVEMAADLDACEERMVRVEKRVNNITKTEGKEKEKEGEKEV